MNLINSLPWHGFLFAPDDKGAGGSGTDGGAGGDKDTDKADDSSEDDKDKAANEKKFSQADMDRVVKERLEREKKKTEETAAKAKADAEAAALAEQGKYKELAEKSQKEAEAKQAEKEKAEAELKSLKLRSAFEKAVGKLSLAFANEAAAQDAFEKLDVESVGEDFKGMDEAIKKLHKERPYLFGEVEAADIDARQKGQETTAAANEKLINQKKRDGRYTGL